MKHNFRKHEKTSGINPQLGDNVSIRKSGFGIGGENQRLVDRYAEIYVEDNNGEANLFITFTGEKNEDTYKVSSGKGQNSYTINAASLTRKLMYGVYEVMTGEIDGIGEGLLVEGVPYKKQQSDVGGGR